MNSTRFLTALTANLLISASALAGPIPSWSYYWEPVSGLSLAPSGGFTLEHNLPNSSITYGLEVVPHASSIDGPWTAPIRNQQGVLGMAVSPITNANQSGYTFFPANTYGVYNDNYSLRLHVRDNNSGEVGSVLFSGRFDGTFFQDSSPQITLQNTVIGPSEQELYLGSYRYIIDFGTFDPPTDGHGISPDGPPYAAIFPGELSTTVTLTGTPEPATLLMVAVGLGAVGIGRTVRRRPAVA